MDEISHEIGLTAMLQQNGFGAAGSDTAAEKKASREVVTDP